MSNKGRIGRVALAAGFAAAVAAAPTQAQERVRGHVRVSVERMSGFTYNSLSSATESTVGRVTTIREVNTTWTAFNLFGTGFSTASPSLLLLSSAQAPRVAVDYELANHLTLGGAAFFAWNSITDDDGDGYSSVGFGIAPRVGYSLRINDRLSFWPRVGATFSYTSASPQDVSATSSSLGSSITYAPVWINLEPLLVFAATPSFQFTFGLYCDIPVAGGVTTTSRTTVAGVAIERTSESTLKQFTLGAQLGVMGRF